MFSVFTFFFLIQACASTFALAVTRESDGNFITYIKDAITVTYDKNKGLYYATELYFDENEMLSIRSLDNPKEIFEELELQYKEKSQKEE